jgi:hypothetical protein
METIMRKLSVKYPESIPAVINLSPEIFEKKAITAMAVKLFEIGMLTSGQAASLAGISRVEFLLSCHQFEASSVEWDDEQELKLEFSEKI